jgi:hypothetical protein
MTWAEIVQRDFADEGSSEPMLERVVQMNFAATETTGTFTTWFRLPSELSFPTDEVDFVAGPGVTIRDDVLVLPNDGTSVIFDPDDNFADPLIVYSDDVEYWEIPPFSLSDGDDFADLHYDSAHVYGEMGYDTISSTGGAVVDGGTGDDVLTGQHGDTHFGGAGNDVLSGASSMSGGDGNDTISGYYELSGGDGDDLLTSYANPYAAGDGDALGMSGDAGNDTLTASADIGYDNTPSVPGSYLGMSGGEGSDVSDIQLEMSSPGHLSPSPTVPTQTSTYLNIADFDPAEDVLTVQINRDEEGADREMISAEIVGNEVLMTFAATETDGVHSASIWLGSSVDVSIEDIVFIQN